MSRPRLYSYSACSTCRKALAWLRVQGIEVDLVDITTTPPSATELQEAFLRLGRQRLFNSSGQSYRALGAAAVKALSDKQALAALASDGKLIKRPFLVMPDGRTLTGFQPAEWQTLLDPRS